MLGTRLGIMTEIGWRLSHKGIRALIAATSGDSFVLVCFGNDEARIARYARLIWGLELTSRLCHTAPLMELKFSIPEAAYDAYVAAQKAARAKWATVARETNRSR